jgi:putative ABC transport system permease protein
MSRLKIMAVLSLGLGIGANASLFTLVNAALFRPPAGVNNPDRLLGVGSRRIDMPATFGNISYPDYVDVRDQTREYSTAWRAPPLPRWTPGLATSPSGLAG